MILKIRHQSIFRNPSLNRNHSACVLSLSLFQKEEKNDHQWLMTVAKTTPRAGFTLRREHCNSSSWFRVLYTIRETSLVTNNFSLKGELETFSPLSQDLHFFADFLMGTDFFLEMEIWTLIGCQNMRNSIKKSTNQPPLIITASWKPPNCPELKKMSGCS